MIFFLCEVIILISLSVTCPMNLTLQLDITYDNLMNNIEAFQLH